MHTNHEKNKQRFGSRLLDGLLEPFRHPRVLDQASVSQSGKEQKEAASTNRTSVPGGFLPGAMVPIGARTPPASLIGGKGRKQAKAKNAGAVLRRIWRYLIAYRGKLIGVLLLVVATTGLALLGPYLAGTAVDRFIEGSETAGFGLFIAMMIVAYVLYSLTMWLQNIWMIGISQRTVLAMRTELFSKLHRLPIPYFAKRQQGDMMSRVTNDIENVSSTLNSSVIQLFSSVLMLLGVVTLMLLLNPLLTLLTFLVVPLMMMGMKWITSRTGRLFRVQQRNVGAVNGHIEETLSGQRIIKAFSQEQTVSEQFAERNEQMRQSGFWSQAISGFVPKLMNALNNLSFALIAGAGAILVIKGGTTVGTLLIFIEYSRQFTRPLNDLANQWNTMLSAIAGAERVFEVLDEREEKEDEGLAKDAAAIVGSVAFENVSFGYSSEGSYVLEDISFVAQPGEMIALVGPTGAGKTSLIQLLSRFYEPSSGRIVIDGVNATDMKRESLRSQMAFVLQETFLFEGTVMENIRYGRLTASDEEVKQAAKLANAHFFITRMRGGYEARLGQGGSGISQGQKQLLAIARAILCDPAILVLDEATSSIDTVTEIKIQEALQRLMKGRTSFVIAHRLGTIRQADRIIMLQHGKIAESGSHEDLMASQGFYYRLHHSLAEQQSV